MRLNQPKRATEPELIFPELYTGEESHEILHLLILEPINCRKERLSMIYLFPISSFMKSLTVFSGGKCFNSRLNSTRFILNHLRRKNQIFTVE